MIDLWLSAMLWGGILALYCAPGLIATARDVRAIGQVWVINILLGWTFFGWIAAMTMAFRDSHQREQLARHRGF